MGTAIRPARGKAKPARSVASTLPEVRSFEDLLGAPQPLPGEDVDEIAQLRAAILADLAPRSAYERIIVANLVELECEHRRLRRWIVSALREQMVRQALDAVARAGGQTPAQRARLRDDLMAAEPQRRAAARARLVEAGVDLDALMARVRLELDDGIARLEVDLRETERRRRGLFGDLDRLRLRHRAAAVPDAEIEG